MLIMYSLHKYASQQYKIMQREIHHIPSMPLVIPKTVLKSKK